MAISIQTSADTCEAFKESKITNSIMKESGVDKEQASKIARSIKHQLEKSDKSNYTTAEIRNIVYTQLDKRGLYEEAHKYDSVGVPAERINSLLFKRQNDNANSSFNPESIFKYVADDVFKQYALEYLIPKEEAQAHIRGFLHYHDLNYFATRLNCLSHDPRFFFKKGLMVDGDATQTVYAKPPKSISAVINWMGQILGTSQCHFGGAQGISMVNLFLSPFTKGLSDVELKQSIQSLIFNLGLSYVSRGGEVAFSNLNVELCGIPEFMMDKDAIGVEGKVIGIYGDYVDESRRVASIIIDVLMEGDGFGRFHTMPNTAFVLRSSFDNDPEYQNLVYKAHQLAAKFPTPYFLNPDIKGEGGHNVTWGPVGGDTKLTLRYEDGHVEIKKIKDFAKKYVNSYGKFFVSDNIETLTLDDEDNIIWHPIKSIFKNPKETVKKYTFAGNGFVVATPNHEVFTSSNRRKPFFEANANIKGVHFFNSSDEIEVDYEGILLGLYLGDGNWNNKNAFSLMILKDEKIDYIQKVLNNLNYEYTISNTFHSRDQKLYTNFYVKHNNPKLFKKEKNIFWENILADDTNYLAGILCGLINTDGYIRLNRGGFDRTSFTAEFVSTNPEIIDIFKYCCFRLGLKFSSRWISAPDKQKNRVKFCRVYLSCNKQSINLFKKVLLREPWATWIQRIENNYRDIGTIKSTSIKKIESLSDQETYCLEVNGRMIVGEDQILVSNCRSTISSNWTGDPELDTLRTGNTSFVTLNLPRYAHLANNEDEFFGYLDKYMGYASNIMILRKEIFEKNCDNGMMKFLTQKGVDGEPYYRLENGSYSFGNLGIEETLRNLNIGGLTTKEGQKYSHKILDYINNNVKSLKESTGLRFSHISSPAESAAGRLATIDKEKLEANVLGDSNGYYYTNGTHVRVSENINLLDRIKIESKFHKKVGGGSIFHAWLGMKPEVGALMDLSKIMKKYDTRYWTYTNDYSVCNDCHESFNGLVDICPFCSSNKTTSFSKISGYIQKIDNWNKSKRSELCDRKRY